ncbi:MAG: penicillin-binding transpeptidase domain-containing protein [Deltaproteobacteria bacterium]
MTDRQGTIRWIRLRILLLAAAILGVLCAMLGRALQLQLGDGARLARLAREQYLLHVALPARRGEIFDRNGVALASSVQVESIYANPGLLAQSEGAAALLARALRLDPRSLERKLDPSLQFAWVKRQVTQTEAEAVRRLALPGIGFVKESRRFYPERELAAQLLGVTGLDGEGLEGLEKRYDDELRGKTVLVSGVRDAKGHVLTEASVSPTEIQGGALHLTIDQGAQYLVQTALAKQVAQTRSSDGIAIALEPRTGAILAMAVVPTFNPNSVDARDRAALRDRAVADAFEPGSTFKAFLAAAALQERVVTPQTPLFGENGAYRLGGRTIHDHKPFGWMSFARVLQVSSNVGAAKVGLSLGRERLYRYLRDFGFGERTGVGLPGEVRGALAPFRSDIANATASFGQGVTATPLQIVTAYGALANGGELVPPRLVQEIVQPNGQVVVPAAPEPRRVVKPEVAAAVTRMLEGVVQKGGTAEAGAVAGYRVAGKTGTAQKADPITGGYSADKRFASFVGYLPAERPRVVIGVFLDEPKGEVYGGVVAAPVFREIAEGLMARLAVPPDAPMPPVAAAIPAKEKRQAPPALELVEEEDDAGPLAKGTVPKLLGLPARRAVGLLAATGLLASLQGEGQVVSQQPAPGAAAPADRRVLLTLAPDPGLAVAPKHPLEAVR